MCNSISQIVHQTPSKIFIYVGVVVMIASIITFFTFPPHEEPVGIRVFCEVEFLPASVDTISRIKGIH